MIVDDSKINQILLKKLLEKIKYNADIVENGQQAVEALSVKSYDVIMMDVQMPVMDGYEATRIIRAEKKYEKFPYIVAISANVQQR